MEHYVRSDYLRQSELSAHKPWMYSHHECEIKEKRSIAMKVIGAGFGRTGTLYLKAALERLGFAPCYHVVELPKQGHEPFWKEAARKRARGSPSIGTRYSETIERPWISPAPTFTRSS